MCADGTLRFIAGTRGNRDVEGLEVGESARRRGRWDGGGIDGAQNATAPAIPAGTIAPRSPPRAGRGATCRGQSYAEPPLLPQGAKKPRPGEGC